MNWQQKLSALQAIADTALRMRKPDDWYVSATGRDVVECGGCILAGSYGNGRSPEEAVEDDWRQVAESGLPLKTRYPHDGYLRWNGFMWQHITHEQACATARNLK